LSDGDELQVDFAPTLSLPHETPSATSFAATGAAAAGKPGMPADLQAYLDEQEREILVKALNETGFNRTAAASRLGLSLRQIRYRIARLNISMPPGDEPHDQPA
jgi:two-component system response regulator PilR (NtrC family)